MELELRGKNPEGHGSPERDMRSDAELLGVVKALQMAWKAGDQRLITLRAVNSRVGASRVSKRVMPLFAG